MFLITFLFNGSLLNEESSFFLSQTDYSETGSGNQRKKESLLNDLNKFKRSFIFIQLFLFLLYTEKEIK